MQNQSNQNNKLFIFGIINLVISLSCILYSLYILPFLIWNLSYEVADTVLELIAYFEDTFYYSKALSRLLTWLVFFIPGVITGLLAWYASLKIEKRVLGADLETPESGEDTGINTERLKRDMRESAGFGMKIVFLIFCVLGLFAVIQLIL